MVKVYALTTCPWCKKVKQLLDEKGINYQAVDVDLLIGDEQNQVLGEVEKLTGKRSFPVTVINDVVVEGFKSEDILEALKNEQ
ncbi:MAG: glutaredoxin family protein [Desulfotomaculaceae bacterium]